MTVPEPVCLSLVEQQVYDALCEAADNNQPCPLNLDIEMLTGFASSSMGPVMIRKLEEKGLIVVKRYQRFREVQIVATGKWTARSPSQHTTNPHVRRGCGAGSRSPYPTERKGYRGRVS